MKKIFILIGIFIVVVVSGFVYAKGTPLYTLFQLRRAIENHDVDTAMRYLDVDSIVDNQMVDFLKEQNQMKPTIEFEQIGNSIVKERMAMMIPLMKEAMKGQFKTSITIPSDDETPVNIIRKGSLSDFVINTKGEIAILSRKNDKDVNFKMVKAPEGHWKIVQLMKPETMKSPPN